MTETTTDPALMEGTDAAPDVDPPDPDDDGLFDPAMYDDPELKLVSPDGVNIDAITLGIGGQITLDRFDRDHVALVRALHLGQRLEIRITAQADRTGYRQVRRRQRTDTVQHTQLGVGSAIEWRIMDTVPVNEA